jgi:hypothetical protein
MRVVGAAAALALALMVVTEPVVAQTPSLGQVFKRVNPSVVIVRTKEPRGSALASSYPRTARC